MRRRVKTVAKRQQLADDYRAITTTRAAGMLLFSAVTAGNDFELFTQPPMRRMRICFTDFFLFFFYLLFFRPSQKYQPSVLGNG